MNSCREFGQELPSPCFLIFDPTCSIVQICLNPKCFKYTDSSNPNAQPKPDFDLNLDVTDCLNIKFGQKIYDRTDFHRVEQNRLTGWMTFGKPYLCVCVCIYGCVHLHRRRGTNTHIYMCVCAHTHGHTNIDR